MMVTSISGRQVLKFAAGFVLLAVLYSDGVHMLSVTKDLSNNHIVTFNLTEDTQHLNLSFNSIGDLSPDSFERTPSLETLDLSHNRIETLANEPFIRLQLLRVLNLSANLLTHFDCESFDNSPLQLLDLHANRLETGRFRQRQWQTLHVLNLASNRFTGNLTLDFNRLEILILDNNRNVTTIHITNPVSLTNLSINSMTVFVDRNDNYTNLRHLSLTNCTWDPNLNMLQFVELAEQLDFLDFRFSDIFCSNHTNLQYFQTLIRDFPLNSDLKCLGPNTFKGRKVKNLYLSPMLVKQRLHFAIVFPVIVIFILLITLLTVLALTDLQCFRFRRQSHYAKLESIATIPSVYNPVYIRSTTLFDTVA